MTDVDGREARNSLSATALRSATGGLVGVLLLALAACSQQGGQTQGELSPSASHACMTAFADASAASDPVGTAAALEAALGACRTADDWMAAAERHASGLEGVDAQQFLIDRCLEGPPDLAETTLCQTVEADR